MKIKHLLFVVVACTLAVAGCKKPEPIVEPDSITVDPSALTFDGKAAGSAQVTVTANTSWSASGAPSWVTVTPSSGSTGTAKVTVSVEAGVEQARNASIIFTAGKASKTVEISQAAGDAPAVPSLSGEVTQVELQAEQTEATFKITASNLKGKWTVTPKATYDWVSDFTKEGTTSGNIVVKVLANTTANDRTAEFTVAAEGVSNVALTLVQKGAASQPDGTIKTADELIAWFAAPTAAAKLGADIDLTGKTFSPVADLTVEFDGNGKTITVKDLETPVFTVAHAAIKNVVFAGSFKGSPSNVKFHLAPIGKSYAAIENVINKATVTVTGAAPEDGGGTVAGIVCEAYGPVKNCKNEGKISVDASGKDTWTYAVAGIAGFLGAAIEGCDNSGEVILVAGSPLGRTAVMTEVTMKYNPVSSVAGVVAYAVSDHTHDVTVTNCNNTAKVTFTYDNINDESAAVSRSSVAGVVANSGGDIKNCNNRGEINGTMVTATPEVAFSTKNIILHAAGIQGADYFVSKIKAQKDQNETSVIDCNNYGNINVNTNITASNNAVGGVSAWPAAENASITVIKNCTNSGNITVKGLGKIRVGGIAGGTNSIEDCKSTGNILVEGADPSSVFGLINGFHTQTHTLSNCEATGKLESKVAVNGLGGLCGGIGNAKNEFGENCKVNATLIGGGTEQVGLIVGHLNGRTNAVTVGTADKPVRVAGSVDGVEATADNFMTLIHKASNYMEGIHTFNVVFGK